MQSLSTNDKIEWKLRKDKQVWKGEFSNGDGKKLCYLMTKQARGVISRVGMVTEKAQVLAWVLTLGTDSKWKPDDQSPLGLGAKESMGKRYEGSSEERVW